jgi:hypothetical protein
MGAFDGYNTTDPVINAQTRGPTVVAIALAFSIASLTVVILRMYTRMCIVKCAGSDDVTIILAEV